MGNVFGCGRTVAVTVAETVADDSLPLLDVDELSSVGATSNESRWEWGRMRDVDNYVHMISPEYSVIYQGSGEMRIMYDNTHF